MKNNNVLNACELHNQGIDSKDCKNCVYNCENGCPSSQSSCWFCKDKSEFSLKRSKNSYKPFIDDTRLFIKNFDLLSKFLLDEFSNNSPHSYKFSAIGFDFDSDNFLRQIQPMVGYDLFEVLKEVYHNSRVYGEHFCILHHDLNGFHYICY